ncbi:pH-response transcription factor pacC [Penicillium oxalicum]|uniref:pH-response transcription factor pacC n=1 Tax=Penicillium oxalicum TaxID=69781 RepID=UPI0020B6BAEF|nr:pH-response transcription factor pacC [Penicillium oxalicum]KAI2792734.1 pH-response transcription factor pacC [Penicillium oxalicum]
MSDHPIPPNSPPQATAPAPAESVASEQPATQSASTPTPSVAATAAAATAAVNNTLNGSVGEQQLPCQWVGCGEKSPSAEALYVSTQNARHPDPTQTWSAIPLFPLLDLNPPCVVIQEHVCERHVGRKSTNNLNLTCQWGNCNTTTVKRDHITSHIRVHVPLKPHKCDFCGKAFKRPQDLKKHVKTHADDSEIRSPEPSMKHHHHHPDMMFPQNPKGYAAATHYFEGPMSGVSSAAYAHGGPQYYTAHPPPPAPNPHSYGNVYYALSHDSAQAYDRKRGYDALNEFFGDLKRRQFDPNSYAAVGQRLLGLQALQLPILNGPVPEYQPMPAAVPIAAGGGYSPGGHAPAYHLPPMSNVRTKNDLINIDQFLEQMQNTIYESDENVAAAGVAQPGAHYVHGG